MLNIKNKAEVLICGKYKTLYMVHISKLLKCILCIYYLKYDCNLCMYFKFSIKFVI